MAKDSCHSKLAEAEIDGELLNYYTDYPNKWREGRADSEWEKLAKVILNFFMLRN